MNFNELAQVALADREKMRTPNMGIRFEALVDIHMCRLFLQPIISGRVMKHVQTITYFVGTDGNIVRNVTNNL